MLRLLLCLTLVCSSLPSFADVAGIPVGPEAGPPEPLHDPALTFQFVLPLKPPTFRLDRHGNLRFEYRDRDLEGVGCALDQCRERKLTPNYDNFEEPVEIWVYLPTQYDVEKYQLEIAQQVTEQFVARYPKARLEFKFVPYDSGKPIHYVFNRVKSMLNRLKSEVEGDPQAVKQIENLKKVNERQYNRAIAKALWVPSQVAENVKEKMAKFRSGFTGALRAFQMSLSPAVMAGGKPAAIAMGIVVSDMMIEYMSVKYAKEIQEAFEKAPFRAFSTRARATWSQILNSGFWNFTLNGLARPIAMQAAVSLADPNTPLPDLSTIGNVAQWGAVGAAIYVGFTRGWMALRDKAQISAAQVIMLMQGLGLLDVITAIENSNPAWHHLRWYTWGPQWAVYAGIAAWGLIASNRMNRLLLVDSRIVDWERLHNEHPTNMSWHIQSDEDFQSALKDVAEKCELDLLLNETPGEAAE